MLMLISSYQFNKKLQNKIYIYYVEVVVMSTMSVVGSSLLLSLPMAMSPMQVVMVVATMLVVGDTGGGGRINDGGEIVTIVVVADGCGDDTGG